MEEYKPTLVLSGPILNNSGYGRHATDIACSLLRQNKYDLKLAFQKWGACPTVNLDEEYKYNPYVDELLKRMIKGQLTEQPEVFMQVSIPNEFQTVAKYNIGITAGIETTAPNGTWVEGLNRMNMNIVPSVHAKKVFETVQLVRQNPDGSRIQVKMERPMEVVFEGCNTKIYKVNEKGTVNSLDNYMKDIPEDFVFLFVGHWIQGDLGHDRKDIGTLVKLFCEVFKNKKKKPALLLKTSGATLSIMDRNETAFKINKIKESIGAGDFPNIYLLHGELTDVEVNDLYNHPKIKTMINLTHGEGFGRPLLEFSMTGKPIIASGWSGHVDFLNRDNAILLPGTLQNIHPSAVNEWVIKESQWFYVNQSITIKVLEDIYNNYEKFSTKCDKLRIINSEKYSMEAFDKVFWSILDKYIPEFPKKAQVVLPKLKLKKKSETPVSSSIQA